MKKNIAFSVFFVFLSILVWGDHTPIPNFTKLSVLLTSNLELVTDTMRKFKTLALNGAEFERIKIGLELRNTLEHKRVLENEIAIIEENVLILEKSINWKEKISENRIKILELEIEERALDIERIGYREKYASGILNDEEYETRVKEIGFERQKIMSTIHSLERQNAILKVHGIKDAEELEKAIESLKNHLGPIRMELEKTLDTIEDIRKNLEKNEFLVKRLKSS